MIGTDRIVEQQPLQERIDKYIVRVYLLLVSYAKKRRKVLTIDGPQLTGDPWEVMILLGPVWTRAWDCQPSLHKTILERFPMLIVKAGQLNITRGLILFAGNTMEQRRIPAEETRVHG